MQNHQIFPNLYYSFPFSFGFDPNYCCFFYAPNQNGFCLDSNMETKYQPICSELTLPYTPLTESIPNNSIVEDIEKPNPINPILNERKIKENLDEQYSPNFKVSSKPRKQQQNQMRNIIPNTVHQIISFIQKQTKSKQIIQKLICAQANQTFSTKRFFLYQKLVKEQINNYVNARTLELLINPIDLDQTIFKKCEIEFYCKISRILIKLFLNQESNCIILTSSKIKQSNKILHLKAHRILIQMLTQ